MFGKFERTSFYSHQKLFWFGGFFLDFLKILNIILNPKSYCFKLLYMWGFLIFLGYGALISESGLAMPDLV